MKLSKTLIGASILAGLSVVSTNVLAADFPDFKINDTAYGGTEAGTTNFDVVAGDYFETTEITGANTFQTSLLFDINSFKDSQVPGSSYIFGGYNMYARYQAGGTFTTDAAGTHFVFDGSGTADTLELWIDDNNDTTFGGFPVDGSTLFSRANFGDDVLLATGETLFGNGDQSCSNSNNCGSYGVTTSFNLTSPDGTSVFVDPIPFYSFQIATGQFNGIPTTVGTVANLTGTQDAVFTEIPEPSTLALLGMGLLGFGIAKRKKA